MDQRPEDYFPICKDCHNLTSLITIKVWIVADYIPLYFIKHACDKCWEAFKLRYMLLTEDQFREIAKLWDLKKYPGIYTSEIKRILAYLQAPPKINPLIKFLNV